MEDTITMTPEIWTILGTGFTLVALGSTGFTLLWRYITRAEQRMEARFNELKADLGTAKTELKADLGTAKTELKADLGTAKTELKADLGAIVTEQKALGGRMHTLEIQMAKLEGLLEGLREALTGKRVA
ncbi:MAG: hypothetical protein OXG35_00095 [Acidobacteria bacterium]|nr:hypothetical protein [Acidobacteriota bacterium]